MKILIRYALEKYLFLVSIYCVLGTVAASVDRKVGVSKKGSRRS